MGFLKFLKKDKKKEEALNSNLDMPPPPPNMNGANLSNEEMDFPSGPPKFSKENDILPKQDIGKPLVPGKEKEPFLDFNNQQNDLDIPDLDVGLPEENQLEDLPDFPSFNEKTPINEPANPQQQLSSFKNKKDKIIEEKVEPVSETHKKNPIEKRYIKEEEKVLSEKHNIISPLYVRLDRFSSTLKDLNIIKTDLKKSDEIIENLINSKKDKIIRFQNWNSHMTDIQKKLIFIEKTLFKGD